MPTDCTVIYFSSVAAHGKELTGSITDEFRKYDREKRKGEQIVLKTVPEREYAFRLGHVLGDYQNWKKTIENQTTGQTHLRVPTDPN